MNDEELRERATKAYIAIRDDDLSGSESIKRIEAVAREARREALEEAAEAKPKFEPSDPGGFSWESGYSSGTRRYQEAIRALAEPAGEEA